MPTLTIRNLPEHVHSTLRTLATQDGISVEAEVRDILTKACMNNRQPVSSLQQLVDQLYQGKKPGNVVEQLIQERRVEAKKNDRTRRIGITGLPVP